jgi:hypothetical protein
MTSKWSANRSDRSSDSKRQQRSISYGSEERLRNITYLFLKFLMVKIDSLNVAVYKNVTTMLNKDLL